MSRSPSKRLHDQGSVESNGTTKRQKSAGNNKQDQPLKSTCDAICFRLLCQASEIGRITGDDGSFLSQISRETGTEVRVEEPVLGCDERVVVINGVEKVTEVDLERRHEDGHQEDKAGKENGDRKEHDGNVGDKKLDILPGSKSDIDVSSVGKALFLVFDLIAESERETNVVDGENPKLLPCVVRLLVLSSQVGCLLGKGGSVIKRMSSESGAHIRILPKDSLPSCASASNEVVQITGEADAVRKALQSVSEQLFGNPPCGPESFPANYVGSSSHSSSHPVRRSDVCREPSMYFGSQRAPGVAGPRDFADFPSRMMPPQETLTFRLLCPSDRVGGVIGKGGAVVKTLKHDTGCEIKILDGFFGSQERVILISGPAHPDDRISPPQDAVLRVQTRIVWGTPDPKDKNVPARLLVSSSQIGCLLGKGGSIIAEMRKFSGAHIRIGSDQVQKGASEGDEIVQIHGEHEAVQEALFQITTRLRCYFFRDACPSVHHPMDPVFLDPGHSLPPYMGRREFSPSDPFSNFGRSHHKFDHLSGPPRRDGFFPHDDHSPFLHNIRPGMPPQVYERKPWSPQGLLEDAGLVGLPEFDGGFSRCKKPGFGGGTQPAIITSTTVEVVVPSALVPVIYGEDGTCLKQIRQFSDAKIVVTDPKPGADETVIIISGTPEQTHAAQSLIQAFVLSETEAS